MITNKNKPLEVMRASNDKYEMLVAEVCYKGEPIIRINQDKGENQLLAEILIENDDKEFNVKMPLDV